MISADCDAPLASLRRKGPRGFEVQVQGARLNDALLDKVAAHLGKHLKR